MDTNNFDRNTILLIVGSLVLSFVLILTLNRSKNKIIRLVIIPPILAFLGLLPWSILFNSMPSLRLGLLGNIIVFVIAWASIAGGLITREKPYKEQNKIIWKAASVYGWSLVILFVIPLLFAIVWLALIISRR